MLRRKSEYVWKFLLENNCDELADNITNGMRCTICGKVMINAHIGGCGCRYCLECATAYLNGESRFCPGNGDDCKQELMVIGENVLHDPSKNQEISKLIVKCPRDGCQFTGALSQMDKHEQVCEKRETKCPYSDIGCSQCLVVKERVRDHLVDESEYHATLTTSFVGSLQNEIRLLSEKVFQLESEIETNRMENGNKTAATEQQVASLQKKCLLLEGQLDGIVRQNRKWKMEMDSVAKVAREYHARVDEVAARLNENNWIKVKNDGRDEFVWCIDKWAARRLAANKHRISLFSEAFYLKEESYRMCLSVRHDSKDFLVIQWRLMRGPFDKHLSWPFEGDVTISLVDQETGLDRTSFTIRSEDYDDDERLMRPDEEINDGFIDSNNTIRVDEISRNPALCRGDRILIRCVVEMNQDN